MGLWITLRQNKETSFFRQNLLNLISNKKEFDGNHLVLASGYFSEYESTPYSVLGDDLLQRLKENDTIKNISVIGAMATGKEPLKTFTIFCSRLKQGLPGRNIRMRKPLNNRWHAKIAIKSKTDEKTGEIIPLCAIIGSSNLARSSYGKNPPPLNIKPLPYFNYECDVLIFLNDGFSGLNDPDPSLEKVFPGITKPELGSIYFPEIHEKSKPESDQLKHLWKQILESTVEMK